MTTAVKETTIAPWKLCSEQMPEPNKHVLVAFRTSYNKRLRFITVAEWVPRLSRSASDLDMEDEFQGSIEHDETTGEDFFQEGWYETSWVSDSIYKIEHEPLYWMEKPELPKDEKPSV
jgi:hypothetical protein